MEKTPGFEPAVNRTALTVAIVDDEIVLDGFVTTSPSLTVDAARETARLLIEAADKISPP